MIFSRAIIWGRKLMDDWTQKRKAELEARAPAKRKKTEPFAVVLLSQAAAMNCPTAMVYLWLKYKARMTGKMAIVVTNTALTQYGVGRMSKHRALQHLEKVGLITVEWRSRKNPVATLQD